MPRTYRGRDILWWMDASGLLDERYDEVPDLVRARNLPSMQLVGSPQRATLDLNALAGLGRAAGRAVRRRPGRRRRSSRARCRTCARWPTSSWAGCWTRSTPGPTGPGSTPSRRTGSRRPSSPAPPPLSARLGDGRDRDDRLGHRLPPRPVLRSTPTCSTARAGRARRRGHRQPRPLPDRPAVPAPPQVDPDRRGRRRTPTSWPSTSSATWTRSPAGGRAERNRRATLHPVAAHVAAAVARRDPQRLSGAADRDRAAARPAARRPDRGPRAGRTSPRSLCALFADFDTVERRRVGGRARRRPAADPLPPARDARPAQRWVCTQTAVCRLVDGRLAVIDLLCSGFREIATMKTRPRHPALDAWGDLRPRRPVPAVRAGSRRRPRCTRCGSPTGTRPGWSSATTRPGRR